MSGWITFPAGREGPVRQDWVRRGTDLNSTLCEACPTVCLVTNKSHLPATQAESVIGSWCVGRSSRFSRLPDADRNGSAAG